MKRLTYRKTIAGFDRAYLGEDDCCETLTTPSEYEGPAVERLAAYEDTGLEPEEIKKRLGFLAVEAEGSIET